MKSSPNYRKLLFVPVEIDLILKGIKTLLLSDKSNL